MSRTLIAQRYRLVRPLGRGGMGTVWLAHDEALDRDVAVKEIVIPAALTEAEGDQARRRSLREARTAARLNHLNVIRMYDIVESDSRQWIVMEYVPSRSLHDVISQDGPLPPERVARIGLGVLAALQAAHRAGVLHRDVKPSNVLLTADGRVVLSDFGLAVVAGSDTTVTRPGMILGSPAYISPERAREGISGPASDLWSLGATLYAAVEGHSPYERSTPIATLTALATEEPDPRQPVRRLAGALAVVLAALLLAALAILPRDEAPSAAPRPTSAASTPGGSPTAQPSTAAPSPAATAEPGNHPPPVIRPPALPAGWRFYHDPTGFTVAVPPGDWRMSREGTIVYFREAASGRVLGIDQSPNPRWDPVADWTSQEATRLRHGDWTDYQRVKIVAVDYFLAAADWEFTYAG